QLPSGKSANYSAAKIGKADRFQRMLDPLVLLLAEPLPRADPDPGATGHQIVGTDGKAAIKLACLGQPRYSVAQVLGDAYCSAQRRDVPHDSLHERRFAGSVRSDNSGQRSFFKRTRHIANRNSVPPSERYLI